MGKGKKQLPTKLKGSTIHKIAGNNLVIILTYFVLQSSRYSNVKETIFKWSLTFILAIPLSFILHPIIALSIAHLLNGIFNGHIPAMLIHMGLKTTRPQEFLNYIILMQKRLSKNSNIEYIYAYGSLSLGLYKPTSDIDLRIVPKKGKWLTCLFILLRERTFAFLNWFPLDIYAFHEEELKTKMRSDEPPINFNQKRSGIYISQIAFEEFTSNFAQINLK